MHDIRPILDLINGYAAKGIMLPRTEFEMSEAIRDFTVVMRGEELLGCGALHFYSPTIGEIRSLAVDEHAKTHGVGRRVVDALVREAQEYELDAVFAFTYVTEFFQKVGFHAVERGVLPLKAWKDCLRCPKFHACDEVAVLRILRPETPAGPVDSDHGVRGRPVHPDPYGTPRLGQYPQTRDFYYTPQKTKDKLCFFSTDSV